MARAEAATGLSLHRDGPVLRLSGVLDRAAATTAWPALIRVPDSRTTRRPNSPPEAPMLTSSGCQSVLARKPAMPAARNTKATGRAPKRRSRVVPKS